MIKKIIFKYGFYTILITLLIGLYIISDNIKIRTKIPINIVADNTQIRVYVNKNNYLPTINDSVDIELTSIGMQRIAVKDIKEEPLCVVLFSDIDYNTVLKGNTYITGYLFIRTVKLKDLIIHKILY